MCGSGQWNYFEAVGKPFLSSYIKHHIFENLKTHFFKSFYWQSRLGVEEKKLFLCVRQFFCQNLCKAGIFEMREREKKPCFRARAKFF
jgi:hypothetical protein